MTSNAISTRPVAAMLDAMGRGEHEQRPSVLSMAQATELGTVYSPAEVTALAELARQAGIPAGVFNVVTGPAARASDSNLAGSVSVGAY